MDPLTSLGNALVIAQRLRKISKNVESAEFANALADLLLELAEAKAQTAELKTRLAAQAEEIAQLQASTTRDVERPGLKWGCYVFDGDESRLYCTGCYDSRRALSLTTRLDTQYRKCQVCGVLIGT